MFVFVTMFTIQHTISHRVQVSEIIIQKLKKTFSKNNNSMMYILCTFNTTVVLTVEQKYTSKK